MDYNKVRKEEKKDKRNILLIFLMTIVIIIFAALTFLLILTIKNKNTGGKEAAATPVPTQTAVTASPVTETTPQPEQTPTPTPAPVLRRGTSEEIPEEVRQRMNGKSMRQNNDISYKDLRYLKIPHYNFNGTVETGEMVVNKAVAEDVLDIFAELYDIKYPIERMELVDNYGADDYTSIDYNNTSAFNYRPSTDGSGRLSQHALGRAIDINPQINPYVNSNQVGSHGNAKEYWSRDWKNWSDETAQKAYIGPDAEIYKIFINHGWEWGGSWSSYRDYQHFQKK